MASWSMHSCGEPATAWHEPRSSQPAKRRVGGAHPTSLPSWIDQLVCERFSGELAGQNNQAPQRFSQRPLRRHDNAEVMLPLPEVLIGQSLKVSKVKGHQRPLLGNSERQLLGVFRLFSIALVRIHGVDAFPSESSSQPFVDILIYEECDCRHWACRLLASRGDSEFSSTCRSISSLWSW